MAQHLPEQLLAEKTCWLTQPPPVCARPGQNSSTKISWIPHKKSPKKGPVAPNITGTKYTQGTEIGNCCTGPLHPPRSWVALRLNKGSDFRQGRCSVPCGMLDVPSTLFAPYRFYLHPFAPSDPTLNAPNYWPSRVDCYWDPLTNLFGPFLPKNNMDFDMQHRFHSPRQAFNCIWRMKAIRPPLHTIGFPALEKIIPSKSQMIILNGKIRYTPYHHSIQQSTVQTKAR